MRTMAGLAAAALLAASLAGPAEARHGRRDRDRIDTDDVIAGAVVVGGIAALAAAIGDNKRKKQDAAVGACAREAEYRAEGRLSEVLGIRKRGGYYTVEGLLDDGPAGDEIFFTCTVRRGTIYSFHADARPY
ncbi:MAG: hypothetical protein ACK40O_04740 [Allosphingosinicella sp.]